MRTLVTGATGLVGNNVVRLLLARGREVRVLTRDASNMRSLEGLDVEHARGDVRDADSVRQAVKGVGLVIHSAAHVHIGWTGLDLARAVNVEGTRNVAEAARAEGIKMVHVSSIDALGVRPLSDPATEDTPPDNGVLCPYVVTKREAEQVVLEAVGRGLNATIVNPSFMLGPWDWKPSSGRMLLQVAKGRGVFAPLGTNNFCDVRDVAEGILLAAEQGQPGRRYILGGETLSYFQAWRLFAHVTGSWPPLLPAGPLIRIAAGKVGDLLTRMTGRESDVNSAATTMSASQRHVTSARAQAELGYNPRPVREAVETAWAWFKEYGYA